MNNISIREFARREGCSDRHVRNAIAKGRLKTLADGSLDAALVGSGWCKTNRRKIPTAAISTVGPLAASGADKPADTADISADSPRGSSHPKNKITADAQRADRVHQCAAEAAFQIEITARTVAEALLPLMAPDQVRAVVGELIRKLQAEAVEWRVELGEALPAGVTAWAEWGGFKGPPLNERDWQELIREFAK